MSIRPPACCRALQRQLPTVSDSVWLSEDHLSAAFQRFCAVSKTTRRYGSFVPGPLEARRRLGKRRMAHLSEAGPTYDSQAAISWGLFGRVDRTQWQWKAPTTRSKTQESPNDILPDWLLSWSNKPDVHIYEEQNTIDEFPFLEKHASIEDEAQYFQIQFPALGLQDNLSRWDKFSTRLQRDLTLGLVSEESIIRIRDMIWDMGGVFPAHETTMSYRLRLYEVLWGGLNASKVFTLHDLAASTTNSFIMQIASLPVLPSMQRLLNEVLGSASTTQLEEIGPGICLVLEKWSCSWLFQESSYISSLDSAYGVPKLAEAVHAANEKLDDLRSLVIALCDNKYISHSKQGPNLESRTRAVHAALNFTRDATTDCEGILALTQTQQQIPMDAQSVNDLAKTLAHVPQHILLPILSNHAKSLTVKQLCSHYFRTCYISLIDQLPVIDTELALRIRRDLKLGGVHSLEPEQAFSVLSHWNCLGLIEEDALSEIIKLVDVGLSSPDKDQIAVLIFSLHEQNHDTWGLLNAVIFMLQKQKRYDELLPILTQLNILEYKIPSVIFNALIRTLYSCDLHAAYSIYKLSHDMLPEGDVMEAYRNSDFIFALIVDKRFKCLGIWEDVLRIPWYNPIPHEIRITLPRDPLYLNEHLFFEQMALKFAHAECRSPGLAFANINQVLWHIRQRKCKPTANISKAMCHAVITRDIARGGPTSGWIGPSRLDYVLGLVEDLEGPEVAKGIAHLIMIWRQYLTEQLEKRKIESQK